MADDAAALAAAPNYANPSYVTPDQLKSARDYANQLMYGNGQMPVHRWTQGVSNIVNALIGGNMSHQADVTQQQAAASNASDLQRTLTQLQNGQPIDPATAAHIYANPMASPEHRATIAALVNPQPITSGFGQPGYWSPIGGVRSAPINGAPNQPFTPSYTANTAGPGFSTSQPYPAPGASLPPAPAAPQPMPGNSPGVPLPAPRPDPTSPQGGAFGGMNSKPVGWDDPNIGPNGAPTRPMTPAELADTGRKITAQNTWSQGNAEAQTNLARQDFDAAANAPTIKRVAGTMLDDLKTHGDQMTFGPTAEVSNNIKRIAANYGPGFMKDQLQGLASADSFDKMTAQLTSLLSKGGGTDAQLFNNMKSVPGSHNSKEGAQALLQMVLQTADQQQQLRLYTRGASTPQEYEQLRNQFFAQNPIVNPITGNPISQDASQSSSAPTGFKILKVH